LTWDFMVALFSFISQTLIKKSLSKYTCLFMRKKKRLESTRTDRLQVQEHIFDSIYLRGLWSCQLSTSFVTLQNKVIINFITIISNHLLNNYALKGNSNLFPFYK
jgi:hypothetical protein